MSACDALIGYVEAMSCCERRRGGGALVQTRRLVQASPSTSCQKLFPTSEHRLVAVQVRAAPALRQRTR